MKPRTHTHNQRDAKRNAKEYTRENGAILQNATKIVQQVKTEIATMQWNRVNRKQFILIYRRSGDDDNSNAEYSNIAYSPPMMAMDFIVVVVVIVVLHSSTLTGMSIDCREMVLIFIFLFQLTKIIHHRRAIFLIESNDE